MTKITISAAVKRIGDTTRKVLTEVGDTLNIAELVVTSTQRTPRVQATVMYDNIAGGREIRYKWAGEQVCKVCRELRKAGKSRAEVIDAMTSRIEELALQEARVSNHCVTDAQYDAVNVIDVSYRHMSRDVAVAAAEAFGKRTEVVKMIQPLSAALKGYDAAEPAIHLEIRQC